MTFEEAVAAYPPARDLYKDAETYERINRESAEEARRIYAHYHSDKEQKKC